MSDRLHSGAKLMEKLEQNVQAQLWNNENAMIQRENKAHAVLIPS